MPDAGFVEVISLNPYWQQDGRTFQDPDDNRQVIHAHLGLTKRGYSAQRNSANAL